MNGLINKEKEESFNGKRNKKEEQRIFHQYKEKRVIKRFHRVNNWTISRTPPQPSGS
jgi:hypothetical protein